MQVSRSRRQLFRDLQRLGCGHAHSERGDQFCGATVAMRERERERMREDAEKDKGGCSEYQCSGETKGMAKRTP